MAASSLKTYDFSIIYDINGIKEFWGQLEVKKKPKIYIILRQSIAKWTINDQANVV